MLVTVNGTEHGGEQTGQTDKHLSGQEQPEIWVVSAKEAELMELDDEKKQQERETHASR